MNRHFYVSHLCRIEVHAVIQSFVSADVPYEDRPQQNIHRCKRLGLCSAKHIHNNNWALHFASVRSGTQKPDWLHTFFIQK